MFKVGDRVERLYDTAYDAPQKGDVGTVKSIDSEGLIRVSFDKYHKENPKKTWGCFPDSVMVIDEFEGN